MTTKEVKKEYVIFNDINYICKSTNVILDALQKGHDVAQLPNGDIIITQVQVVNNHYTWSNDSKKIVKISSQI